MDLLRRWTRVPLSLLSVWVLSGCHSSSGPTAPIAATDIPGATSAPPVAGTLDAGITLRFVSAETSTPAAGVDVSVDGRRYRTDSSGEIRLSEAVALPVAVEASSGEYLLRETVIRSRDDLRHSLWPRHSPTGLDEELTRRLVYTEATGGAPGALRLRRLGPGTVRVSVVPSSRIARDQEAWRAHETAAEALTAATGGAVTFVVEAAASSSVTIQTSIDPNDPAMRNHAALAYRQIEASQITGGRVVFVSLEVARMLAVVTHELGHTFGLEHSSDANDLMHPIVSGPKGLSRRETLAMGLMLQRRPGNRFPDNDRDDVGALGGKRTEVVACADR
jgi:hypothetical protein